MSQSSRHFARFASCDFVQAWLYFASIVSRRRFPPRGLQYFAPAIAFLKLTAQSSISKIATTTSCFCSASHHSVNQSGWHFSPNLRMIAITSFSASLDRIRLMTSSVSPFITRTCGTSNITMLPRP